MYAICEILEINDLGSNCQFKVLCIERLFKYTGTSRQICVKLTNNDTKPGDTIVASYRRDQPETICMFVQNEN